MAVHALPDQYRYFFERLNPTATFMQRAASEHMNITRLIEDGAGPARELAPHCVLQGSYKQRTAIHSIGDIDVVAICRLRPPLSSIFTSARRWQRDEIFSKLAAALEEEPRYRGKVRFSTGSMCLKVDLGIRVEILPVIYHSLLADFDADVGSEPFLLYRPEAGGWEDGYARRHQRLLSEKNQAAKTGGNFIPMVKVLKHLRTHHGVDAVSFHLECLLYALPDGVFCGSPTTYIPAVLHRIAATSADTWYGRRVMTPCGERTLFADSEWSWRHWRVFHDHIRFFALLAEAASCAPSCAEAVATWQMLFGTDMFPTEVGT